MLTRNDTPGAHLIRSYGPQGIRLADRTLRRSCVLSADHLIEPWGPETIDALTLADLEPVFELRVTVVLLTAPGPILFPAAPVRGAFGARRIGLEVMELGAACRTFNVLVQEGRAVAGAFLFARGDVGS